MNKTERKKKMKVSEARFTRRYNVGQYEHEEYSLTAIVDEKDNAAEVLTELKDNVHLAFCGDHDAKAGKAEKVEEVEPDEIPTTDDHDDGAAEEEEADAGTPVVEEEEEASDFSDDAEEEAEEEEPKPAKKERAAKAAPKEKKKKVQTYQRSSEEHKDIFAGILRKVAPDYKKSEKSKALAGTVSKSMSGFAFLDGDGNVLPEFEAQVKKAMNPKGKK